VAQLFSLGRIAYTMKTITLILLCFTLNTLIVCAEDVHLVATQLNGNLVDPVTSKPPTSPAYVLLLPVHSADIVVINPVVFTTFDVKAIGLVIKGAVTRGILTPGSRLGIDVGPTFKPLPDEQIKELSDYCKKLGISVGVAPTA